MQVEFEREKHAAQVLIRTGMLRSVWIKLLVCAVNWVYERGEEARKWVDKVLVLYR